MPGPPDDERRRRLDDERRRRLEEVFGDVLPATTGDERDDREDARGAEAADEQLLADRPPHHDRD